MHGLLLITHPLQIPNIEGRQYPPSLSGALYPKGLPIWSEDDVSAIIKQHQVDRCVLAYSDLEHSRVMQLAAKCLAAGADFELPQPYKSMLPSRCEELICTSYGEGRVQYIRHHHIVCTLRHQTPHHLNSKPVIAVTAVRTGCGKSQTSTYIIDVLRGMGLSCVLVRHPMPYGDLAQQAVQRFETMGDLDVHHVTIEEREEYEQHIKKGVVVYAGVDYEAILRAAEKELADVVIWDGGNNDSPFYKPGRRFSLMGRGYEMWRLCVFVMVCSRNGVQRKWCACNVCVYFGGLQHAFFPPHCAPLTHTQTLSHTHLHTHNNNRFVVGGDRPLACGARGALLPW